MTENACESGLCWVLQFLQDGGEVRVQQTGRSCYNANVAAVDGDWKELGNEAPVVLEHWIRK